MPKEKPLRFGSSFKDHYIEVDAAGFHLARAPLVRDGKRLRFNAPLRIGWDELRDVDAELLWPLPLDLVGTVLNLIPNDAGGLEANPRGYVRLVFLLVNGDALHADIPRSIHWKPDQRWVDEFLAGARAAIEDPAARETFRRQ
jgi:hypothetical protein